MPTAQFERVGFTLIEVLVAAAIISVLTGMGLAAYSRFNARKQVSEAALHFANQLKSVQKRADVGDTSLCSSGFALKAFIVEVTHSDTNRAEVKAFCEHPTTSDSEFTPAPAITLATYRGVVFEISEPFGVQFKVLGRGVSGPGSVVVAHPSVTQQYQVTVDIGGGISVEEL